MEETIQVTERFEKRRLIITLGEKDAPAQYAWQGVTFTSREDGSDFKPPMDEMRPATVEEVQAHIGQAVLDLQAVISAKDALIAQVRAEHDITIAGWEANVTTLRAELDARNEQITSLQQTMAQMAEAHSRDREKLLAAKTALA